MKRALKLLKPVAMTGAALTGAGIAGAVVGGAVLATFAYRKLTASPLPEGAVVVVTGGSRGLGFAIASRFAKSGHVRLVLAARDRGELEQAQASLLALHPHLNAKDFYLFAADLTNAEECEQLIRATISHFGRIDVLVNNAGIIDVGPLEAQTTERFEKAMRLMFFAGLYTTWAALPHMRRQQPLAGNVRARIANISSVGGKVAVPHLLPYSAAKFAMVGFSEGLHAELRHKGIRVTTVCPGLMRTGGEEHARFYGDAEAEAKWFKFMAKTPGLSTSVEHAANVIYRAVIHGCAEVTITPQAALAARVHGIAPATTQCLNAAFNQFVLPKPPAHCTQQS